ncbi:MAG: hypothetical protein Q8Q32_01140 [bacterium]|nr:hypothetical protein [bacterium]
MSNKKNRTPLEFHRHHQVYLRYAKAANWAVEKVKEAFEAAGKRDFRLLKALIKECYVKWKEETSAR